MEVTLFSGKINNKLIIFCFPVTLCDVQCVALFIQMKKNMLCWFFNWFLKKTQIFLNPETAECIPDNKAPRVRHKE